MNIPQLFRTHETQVPMLIGAEMGQLVRINYGTTVLFLSIHVESRHACVHRKKDQGY